MSIGCAHPLAMELADDLEDVACGTGTPVARRRGPVPASGHSLVLRPAT
jgi:hypothetical protein